MKYLSLLPISLILGCTNISLSDRAIPYDDGSFYTVVGGETKEKAHSMLIGVMKSRCEVEGGKSFQLISTKNSQTGEVEKFVKSKSSTKIGSWEFSDVDTNYTQGFDLEAKFTCI
ncbi:hypothetical protein H4J57_18910 [Colwellia sp. BRX8-7]|jgi:hypothetical protein|uniref:hypothetical protein n=1 Tax=Colwellia sp. BRX8-7 TaxID=2759833 RepID=UPI0015F763FE|nr:hypothetical protein [Colwellia sp. BRX8-7]MBA6339261.1 hypothetical protein [Colwellia sp. BRX8-7]